MFITKNRIITFIVFLVIMYNSLNATINCSCALDQLAEIHSKNELVDPDNIFSEPIYISFGFNCTIANMLRKYNLRCLAFPFDWLRTSFTGLCMLLEDDFKDFLNPEYLVHKGGYILNTKYIICFFHDFPTERLSNGHDIIVANYLDYLADITSKYQRRIERFYQAMNSKHTVYCFRTCCNTSLESMPQYSLQQSRQDVERLNNLLKSKFPNSNFTIVALNQNEEYRKSWEISSIKNYYLHNESSDSEWHNILKSLGFIS